MTTPALTFEPEYTASPDDTRIVISVDSQVLSAIQACNQYAAYSHIHHIAPESENKFSLEMGLIVHKMLQYHYENKYSENLSVRIPKAVAEGEQYMLAHTSITSTKVFTELTQAYVGYAHKYEIESFNILAVEERFSRILYQDSEVVIIYNGIIDLLTEGSQVGIVPYDHKTFGSYFKPHGMENQFQGYCWGVSNRTLVVNRIGVGSKLGTYERITLSYPQSVLEEWRINAAESILDHYQQALDKKFRKNFTSCGMYGKCKFKELCLSSPIGREVLIRSDYKEVPPWDPMTRDA